MLGAKYPEYILSDRPHVAVIRYVEKRSSGRTDDKTTAKA